MGEHHKIAWTISAEHVQGDFTCDAPLGAVCRLRCGEECGAPSYPCYSYDETGAESEHELIDSGQCNALEFLAECSPEEAYNGPSNVPIHDGEVVAEWQEGLNFYQWHYVDHPPVPAVKKETSDG